MSNGLIVVKCSALRSMASFEIPNRRRFPHRLVPHQRGPNLFLSRVKMRNDITALAPVHQFFLPQLQRVEKGNSYRIQLLVLINALPYGSDHGRFSSQPAALPSRKKTTLLRPSVLHRSTNRTVGKLPTGINWGGLLSLQHGTRAFPTTWSRNNA